MVIKLRRTSVLVNVSYRMDSAIAPDRHSAAAERMDLSTLLVAKVSSTRRICSMRMSRAGSCDDIHEANASV